MSFFQVEDLNISNFIPLKDVVIQINMNGGTIKNVNFATLLASKAFNLINTFDKNDLVKPSKFTGYKLSKTIIKVKLAPHTIGVLEVE